ncbi:MAG: SAM-dependent methyltransferase [Gammaproteobacteria bacterium]|nr:SAM-dependent methyltransferase [Gammaproteobacteria bacterium]
MTRSTFFELPASLQLRTETCRERIGQEIRSQGGSIGFDRYMQLVLHDRRVGYYHSELPVIGKHGDFVTVPETSAHLAYCLAHACAGLIREDPGRCILEIGAGSGQLALDMIRYLDAWERLPRKYYIHEPSSAFKAVQRELIDMHAPEIMPVAEWLPELPEDLGSTIVIANEVLDALPVKCFAVNAQEFRERCVTLTEHGGLGWCLQNPSAELDEALDCLTAALHEPLAGPYCSEISLDLGNTLADWSDCCGQCVMFLIDYGYPCSEYYHPQRSMGTLRSYFRHRVSEDPFTCPGLQDITVDVDFSALARAAIRLHMSVLSFGSQRNFMLANRLLDWRPSGNDPAGHVEQIARLKQLTLGSAIGERFQVMVLGKGIDYGADRFTLRDMRARL